MNFQYAAGFTHYTVRREYGDEKETLECVYQVDFPLLPTPASVSCGCKYYLPMTLKLHFLSALDASEAMKISDTQTICIRAAEEYWDIANAEIGVRAIKHVFQAKPSMLIPGPVSSECSAKIYRIPEESKTEEQDSAQKMRDEVEPSSFQNTVYGCNVACEFDVLYYAAYCDEKKLWEIDPQKHLYEIGGTRYPFP